jgi:hypothetical protein
LLAADEEAGVQYGLSVLSTGLAGRNLAAQDTRPAQCEEAVTSISLQP